ncbi:MAG: hypothetical protein GY754_06830 [bacterium]|nr:hypothetical protein [bacterium]
MNPVLKIISKVLILINRAIDSFDNKTVETIKRAYFFLIFVLVVIAIIIGYNMGKESATIKSPPLAENMKELFEVDISRERKGGNFNSMLESRLMNELKESQYREKGKVRYPSSERMEPEWNSGISEPGRARGSFPETAAEDKVFEGNYREFNKNAPGVKHLPARESTADRKASPSVIEEKIDIRSPLGKKEKDEKKEKRADANKRSAPEEIKLKDKTIFEPGAVNKNKNKTGKTERKALKKNDKHIPSTIRKEADIFEK